MNTKKFGLELDQKLKELMVEKNFFMKNTTLKLKLILINKPSKFPTLTITVRSAFQENKKLYLQIYLDECLYEL